MGGSGESVPTVTMSSGIDVLGRVIAAMRKPKGISAKQYERERERRAGFTVENESAIARRQFI